MLASPHGLTHTVSLTQSHTLHSFLIRTTHALSGFPCVNALLADDAELMLPAVLSPPYCPSLHDKDFARIAACKKVWGLVHTPLLPH